MSKRLDREELELLERKYWHKYQLRGKKARLMREIDEIDKELRVNRVNDWAREFDVNRETIARYCSKMLNGTFELPEF